jgi:L-alanine-DL-glutamate epimerase-like enolase superfamily enzyme
MRITGLALYQAELTYAGKAYAFSQGRRYRSFLTSVLAVETGDGLTGYGEVCPCGPAYAPAYAEGVLPALQRLAPAALGRDPRETTAMLRALDRALNGHAFAKTALDLACWDLLGKASGQPVYRLLGGKLVDEIPLHRVVPLGDTPEETLANVDALRECGFRHFQVKLGQGVEADIATMKTLAASRRPGEVFVGDANAAWRRDEALRVSAALREVDCILEQPCQAFDACRAVRRAGNHPVKLDESLESLADVRRAIAEEAMDACAIKLSKFGGITASRMLRDLCADAGMAMTVEDAWGGGIATAAIAHLAASTPPEALLNATDLDNYNANRIAHGGPEAKDGLMTVSERPGLGAEPDFEALGAAVWETKA